MKHKTKPLIGYIILLTEVKPALYITLYPKFLNVEQVTHNRSSKMLGKNFPEPFHISGLVLKTILLSELESNSTGVI